MDRASATSPPDGAAFQMSPAPSSTAAGRGMLAASSRGRYHRFVAVGLPPTDSLAGMPAYDSVERLSERRGRRLSREQELISARSQTMDSLRRLQARLSSPPSNMPEPRRRTSTERFVEQAARDVLRREGELPLQPPSSASRRSQRSAAAAARVAMQAEAQEHHRKPAAATTSPTALRQKAPPTRAGRKAPPASASRKRPAAAASKARSSSRPTKRAKASTAAACLKKPPPNAKRDEDYDEQEETSYQNCAICMCAPTKSTVASINGCDHLFCFGCIEKWADTENSCPLCKARFVKIERVHKLKSGGKRKKPANTKRVRQRDQRSDHIMSAAAMQALFESIAPQIAAAAASGGGSSFGVMLGGGGGPHVFAGPPPGFFDPDTDDDDDDDSLPFPISLLPLVSIRRAGTGGGHMVMPIGSLRRRSGEGGSSTSRSAAISAALAARLSSRGTASGEPPQPPRYMTARMSTTSTAPRQQLRTGGSAPPAAAAAPGTSANNPLDLMESDSDGDDVVEIVMTRRSREI